MKRKDFADIISLVEVPGMKPFDVRDKMARYMATIAENRRRLAERKPRYLNGLPVDEPDEDAPLYPPPPPPLRLKRRPLAPLFDWDDF